MKTQLNKIKGIDKISTAKVISLQRRMKKNKVGVYWKEGLTEKAIDYNMPDIIQLLKERKVRYWPQGDSYVLHDFKELIPNYHVYCISAKYFHEHIVPQLNQI